MDLSQLNSRSSCCLLIRLPFSPSDGEAGEDLVRPRRRWRAAPGAAGLGQGPVGGHVRSQTTNPSARLSHVKAELNRLLSSKLVPKLGLKRIQFVGLTSKSKGKNFRTPS